MADNKRLLAFDVRCYRLRQKIYWNDAASSINERHKLQKHRGLILVVSTVTRKKLQSLGHTCRMNNDW